MAEKHRIQSDPGMDKGAESVSTNWIVIAVLGYRIGYAFVLVFVEQSFSEKGNGRGLHLETTRRCLKQTHPHIAIIAQVMEGALEHPRISRPFISQGVIIGGTFNQHHHDIREYHVLGEKGGFERLQDEVAPAAFHNSGERFDSPKCHPNTRVAVMQKIMDWVVGRDEDTRNFMLMWLSGAAGAGKSAIAQSLAELCFSEGHLLASFFFSRSDHDRNHAGPLVATISYQLCTRCPTVQSHVANAIDNNPLIFKQSLMTQFQALVLEPLHALFETGHFNQSRAPRLIVIDGLDECLDRAMQRTILDAILNVIRKLKTRIVFLIASRPEHDIQAAFRSSEMKTVLTHLVLDDAYLPEKDIELFLRDQLKECKESHPFNHLIPFGWPSNELVAQLVRRSSGQFIYAATVMKYVRSTRHRPHHRLEVVLDIRPPSQDLPFAELDALYTHIFSSVANIEQVLRVLSFEIIYLNKASIETIERILGLEPGDVTVLLCDLASVIDQRPHFTGSFGIHFMHASLPDFFLDSARSKTLHIDVTTEGTKHARSCIQFLSNNDFDYESQRHLMAAIFFFEYNFLFFRLNSMFAEDVMKFSIARIYRSAVHASEGRDKTYRNNLSGVLQHFTFRFLPMFLFFLRRSDFSDSAHLYNYHLHSFDEFVTSSLDSYGRHPRLDLQLALIFLSVKGGIIPIGALHRHMQLKCDENLAQFDYLNLQIFLVCTGDRTYLDLMAGYLSDPKRSKQYALSSKTFTGAAICSLAYLCDHHSVPQRIFPQYYKRDKRKRIYQPWTWRRIFRKRKNTPLMWHKTDGLDAWLQEPRDIYRKKARLIYINREYGTSSDIDDPIVFGRTWAEQYYLALHYLLYFLPRADSSDELILLCQSGTFASMSQLFTKKSKRARLAVVEYLKKVGTKTEECSENFQTT